MKAFDPITAGLKLGNTLIERLIPNKTEADLAKVQLAQMAIEGELTKFVETSKLALAELDADVQLSKAQADINAIEAGSDHWFKSYWRPALGWVCVSAFAWHFVIGPIVMYLFSLVGHPVPLPKFEMDALMTILIGMLGLGGMRTAERIAGKIPPGQ